jgi:hypothetical protein
VLQIIAFAACAAVSGWMHIRWRRLDEYDRARVWKHYGWFSALMCIGCCAGAVSFAAWAEWLRYYYLSDWKSNDIVDGNDRFYKAQSSYALVSSGAACQMQNTTC